MIDINEKYIYKKVNNARTHPNILSTQLKVLILKLM